jgi:hypothetical protein
MPKAGRRQDHYEVLGLSPDAPDEVVRAAYRALAGKYHPDRNPGDRNAELKLKRLNAAFHVLGNPEKRKQYDELTQSPEAGDESPPEPPKNDPPRWKVPEEESAPPQPRWKVPGEDHRQRSDARTQSAVPNPTRAVKVAASVGARAFVALVAVGLSLYVNTTGPYAPGNPASWGGMLAGCGLLALFIYWLAGRIPPLACAGGLAVVAALVLWLRANDTSRAPTTSGFDSQPDSSPTKPVATATTGAMRLYDSRTGEPVYVPYDQATDAVASGKYGLPKGSMVSVVLRHGSIGTVAIEEAYPLFADGARFATPEEVAAGSGKPKPAATASHTAPSPSKPSASRADMEALCAKNEYCRRCRSLYGPNEDCYRYMNEPWPADVPRPSPTKGKDCGCNGDMACLMYCPTY